ncbi:MAG: NAD-dependent epimerase/dehydratase family protein [Caldithrix sp.]|nr:NAD-dependent epimerase/dehydratase family protein [Caldithrix sp.]
MTKSLKKEFDPESPAFLNISLAGKIFKTLLDIFFLTITYTLAYLIRFDFDIPAQDFLVYKKTLPVAVLSTIAFINLLRMNQSQWRYSSIMDLINLFGAVTAGWVIFILYLYFVNMLSVPRSVLAIFWMLGFLFLGGVRFYPRFYAKLSTLASPNRKRAIIVGAGDAGEMIIRQMKNDPELGYYPVAIIDDAPRKLHTKIHGVKVIGNTNQLAEFAKKVYADEIIIATPSAPPKQMRHIVDVCEQSEIPFKTVPGPKEIVNGFVRVTQIREVRVEDLLDRTPIEIEVNKIAEYLRDKTVLITGAAGSIGSELARQIMDIQPIQLICVDRTENSLFYLDNELRSLKSVTPYKALIADVLDSNKMNRILSEYKPDIIFHAAAYKHVPLMELHPEAALRNNIIGTYNMMIMAENHGADKFVLISTDKAVNPVSIMGATKRMAELILQSYSAKSKTKMLTVRFGNVLNSYGSVIPLFQKQIARGGPLTITHPDMQRFFMTIPEAVKLIMEATKMSSGNDIFVLDMGEPIKLIEIAHRLIKLSGYEPDKDIPIEYIGMRPGEKLYEELWNEGEVPLQTSHSKITMAVGSHYNHWDLMSQHIDDYIRLAESQNSDGIYQKLQQVIPEYRPYLPEKRLSKTMVTTE